MLVSLLILSCERKILLEGPALHLAGTDRLQMVGVGSLHIDDLMRNNHIWSSSQWKLTPDICQPKVQIQ